jgi:hypothetical protein
MQVIGPSVTYASSKKAAFLLLETKSRVAVHKFSKNIGTSSVFLAPDWWFETSFMYTDDSQILVTTAQNSVARATWCLKFVYPFSMVLETA